MRPSHKRLPLALAMVLLAACARFGYDGPNVGETRLRTSQPDAGEWDGGPLPSGEGGLPGAADAGMSDGGQTATLDAGNTTDAGGVITDAGSTATPDAGGGTPGCTLGDWEAPTMLDIGGTSMANLLGGPGPSSDRLTLFFSMEPSGKGSHEHLYMATRASVESSTFGAATNISELNTGGIEGSPFISADGLTLYYFADAGMTSRQLYYATRPWTSSPFGGAAQVPNLNASGVDQGPRTTQDGLTLVWSSDRMGGAGQEDLYLAARASTASNFTLVRRISELATNGRDQGGSFADGGLTLFFASGRGGSLGGTDLWVATRADATSSFGTPVHLNNVNSASDEFDTAITADGLELFFVSNRGGQTRIWHSLRHCLP